MFTVYRFDAASDAWVQERAGLDCATAYRLARQLETAGTAVRTIVRREPAVRWVALREQVSA